MYSELILFLLIPIVLFLQFGSSQDTEINDPELAWQVYYVRCQLKNCSASEYNKRKTHFLTNHQFIKAHNNRTDCEYWVSSQCCRCHLHPEEIARTKGFIPTNSSTNQKSLRTTSVVTTPNPVSVTNCNISGLPLSLDWTTKGAVTPVTDQGQCGACYAFSAVGAIDGAIKIKGGALMTLSKQQVIDCTTVSPYHNFGCNGGAYDSVFKYAKNIGLTTESNYPYKSKNGTCSTNAKWSYKKICGWTDVAKGSESCLLAAVNKGLVSVGVDSSDSGFMYYSKGIYSYKGTNCDHAMIVVGYGTNNSIPYWKCQNSWGTKWGMGGYILIKRNVNSCGIANLASYPIAC